MICFDIETDGLEFNDPIVSISFYDGKRNKSYGISHPEAELTEKEALDKTQRIILNCDVLINHNIKFDVKRLMYRGIKFESSDGNRPLLIDTQILEWLKSGHRNKMPSLNDIALKYLNKEKVEGLDFKKRKASDYPLKQLLHYNDEDTVLPYELYKHLIQGVSMELVKFYSDLIYLFCEIELNGMHIDEDKLVCLYDSTRSELASIDLKLNDLLEYPINTASKQQLGAALFGGTFTLTERKEVRLKYKTWPLYRWKWRNIDRDVTLKGLGFGLSKLVKTESGQWPTDKATIEGLKGKNKKAKEYVELYKRYGKVKAIFDKFFKAYVQHSKFGYIQGNFNLCNTLTGRLSCSNPNTMQQKRPDKDLPNPKSVFTSRFENGVLLEVDFSGAEWRHAAWRSQDEQMIQDIVDKLDSHTVTASSFHGIKYDEVTKDQRQDAKSINFRFLYGGSAYGFYMSGLVPSKKAGQEYIDGIYKRYPQLYKSHNKDKAVAKAKGRLSVPSGRWYDYSGEHYKDSYVLNYPNQGSSSDMTLACILQVRDKLKEQRLSKDVLIVNTVHDCIVCDCRNKEVALKAKDIIEKVFTNARKYVNVYFKDMNINVPIECESEIGINWGEMKEV